MSGEPWPCAREGCGHAPTSHDSSPLCTTCFACWYRGTPGMNHAYLAPKRISCIRCGKPVLTAHEGRIHDRCYGLAEALLAQEGDD